MSTSPAPRSSLLTPLAWLAGVAALAYLWLGWCAFPASNWNEFRLAPTFALVHGGTIYPPADGGPLSTWIYGPIGLLVNLPATLARSASAAIEIAGVLNLLTLVVPLALICLGAPELRARGRSVSLLAFATAVLLLPTTSLQFQVADHTAIALGLLSCLLLVRSGGRQVIVPAALAALALWSKQTALYLLPAQALWLFASGQRRAAGRYAAWATGFSLVLLGVSGVLFGFSELWLNLVEIPARLPWGDVSDKLLRRAPQLAVQLGLPILVLLALARTGRWPAASTQSGQFLRLALYVAVASVALGFPSFCKIGGDLNALHAWFYLAPALVVVILAQDLPRWDAPVLVAVILLARAPEFRTLPTSPQTAALVQAEQISRGNPSAVWFPDNPLVTYFTDGKFYHVEDGIATRHLAGLGLREASFRRHLPRHLAGVVYPANQTEFFALQLLPDFNRCVRSGEWTVFVRAAK